MGCEPGTDNLRFNSNLTHFFDPELDDTVLENMCLQHDGATCHTVQRKVRSMLILSVLPEEKVIVF